MLAIKPERGWFRTRVVEADLVVASRRLNWTCLPLRVKVVKM